MRRMIEETNNTNVESIDAFRAATSRLGWIQGGIAAHRMQSVLGQFGAEALA